MSFREADTLLYYLQNLEYVTEAKVYEKTADASVCYIGERDAVILVLKRFCFDRAEVPEDVLEHSGREMNALYQDKLVNRIVLRMGSKLFLPYPVRTAITLIKSWKYLRDGFSSLRKKRIEVSVLDATAIGVSILRGNMDTAGSVMFLLGIGEILEEWTHKKSVGDLARSMSLNIPKVWIRSQGQEVLVDTSAVSEGDLVVVHMGNIIPFDGIVAACAGVDEYYSEVLPEDKAGFIAREIADITIAADNLMEIAVLKHLSDALMKRIRRNYRTIVGSNTSLIVLGAGGIIRPTTSAMLHNLSTIGISVGGMKNLLEETE